MSPQAFRLILLISCAHALVHVFEMALPSVELMIGEEFDVGKNVTGPLGTVWRIPFGVGAFLAGWLADRYGSKPLLIIYLFGCAAMGIVAWASSSLSVLFAAMFVMGCFASIYHPAGLALISRETTPETRGAALGWHGIFGSVGIASAPFLAAVAFSSGDVGWRQYYLLLTLPAVALGLVLWFALKEHHRTPKRSAKDTSSPADDDARWRHYFLLVVIGTLQGFIYAGFMHFLPRYLDEAEMIPTQMAASAETSPARDEDAANMSWTGMTPASARNYLAAMVLLCGVVGQAIAGKFARPGRLEVQLSAILLANAPFLAWMSVAAGPARLWATCLLALVHFMTQPVYNSLIAQYVPRARRSVSYGFSNMMAFGIGALAPTYAGMTPAEHWTEWTYGVFAGVAIAAGLLALFLRPRV